MKRKPRRTPIGSLFGTYAKFKVGANGAPKVVFNPARIPAQHRALWGFLESKGITTPAALLKAANDDTDAKTHHAARAWVLLDAAGTLNKESMAAFFAGAECALMQVERHTRKDVEESRARKAARPRAVAARWSGKHRPKITPETYADAVKRARRSVGQRGHRKEVAKILRVTPQAVHKFERRQQK